MRHLFLLSVLPWSALALGDPRVLASRYRRSLVNVISIISGASLLGGPLVPVSHAQSTAQYEVFKSKDGQIQFNYPDTFKYSEKPVKTHVYEALFRSEDVKGYMEGITVRYIYM
jgi:hypothetical protein